ncbi:hypothetical protein, partial [Limnohabitans sp.]|uniref:hypothetical protein n=1 Tax=Limnohabitans sp. TaxID=1907725 RepID=UPI00391CDEA9
EHTAVAVGTHGHLSLLGITRKYWVVHFALYQVFCHTLAYTRAKQVETAARQALHPCTRTEGHARIPVNFIGRFFTKNHADTFSGACGLSGRALGAGFAA